MDNSHIWDIITKKLNGEITAEESGMLQDWIHAKPENKTTLVQAEKIWSEARDIDTPTIPNVDRAWEKLAGRIDNSYIGTENKSSRSIGKNYRLWLGAAASVLLVVVFLFTLRQDGGNPDFETSSLLTTVYSRDSVRMVYLPDSSQVWLNGGSSISYNQSFGIEDRHVSLIGEAFFDIKRDTTKVFIIQAGGAEVRVLGTAFNVKADNGNNQAEVVVESGKVAFSPSENRAKTVFLRKGDKGVFSRGTDEVVKSKANSRRRFFWMAARSFKKKVAYGLKGDLNHVSRWAKNWINQSVVNGEITNNSSHITYSDIRMKYFFYNKKGVKKGPFHFTVFKTVKPGESIEYRYGLLDIFTKTDRLEVEVEHAKVMEEKDVDP